MEMHFATIWESIADAIPDAPALTHDTTTRSWSEFDDRAARIASALVAAGLGPDSKVGLYLYNGNEYCEAQFGVFKMRGVSVNACIEQARAVADAALGFLEQRAQAASP